MTTNHNGNHTMDDPRSSSRGAISAVLLAVLVITITLGWANSGSSYQAADTGKVVQLIEQGQVKIFAPSQEGREVVLCIFGPGDFFGVRQSGVPALQMADLSDTPLIELSRSLAARLWESDPYLKKPEHKALREKMHLFWQDMMAH